jgi:hypothetical protein
MMAQCKVRSCWESNGSDEKLYGEKSDVYTVILTIGKEECTMHHDDAMSASTTGGIQARAGPLENHYYYYY